jgi:urease accessory protein
MGSGGRLENQVLAGVKTVPLGQRALLDLAEVVPATVNIALALEDADICASAPALAIASSRHETQYSRLFRS